MLRMSDVNVSMPIRIAVMLLIICSLVFSSLTFSTTQAAGDEKKLDPQVSTNVGSNELHNAAAAASATPVRVRPLPTATPARIRPNPGTPTATPERIRPNPGTPTATPERIRPAAPTATSARIRPSSGTPTATPERIQADTFPLPAGSTIVRGQKYYSVSGNHYLIFQPDGNVVVYTAADQYVWGLQSVTDNYGQTQSVRMQDDGNFVVRGANDELIWSALDANPDPSAYLHLTPDGVLQLVSGNTGATLWASNGDLSGVAPTVAPTVAPITEATTAPTVEPTAPPAAEPTVAPTAEPTAAPTTEPTAVPTAEPTAEPIAEPTTVCTQADFLAAVKEGETSGTITLDGTCRYQLTSASDTWNGGSGAFLWQTTLIEGNGAVIERSADAPNFRILAFQVPAGTTIRNLTIRNGASAQNGGGLFANSALTLENVTLAENTSTARGGAISAAKDLTLTNSRLVNNRATAMGGAIYAQGNLVLQGVTIAENASKDGGAIAQLAGALTVGKSQLSNNHAADMGGAIFKQAGALEITNTLFAQNRADKGNGAALFVGGGVTGNATMTNNTITDNGGNAGTAVTLWSPVVLRNTIIANHETALATGKPMSEDYNLFANNMTDVKGFNGVTVERGGHSVQVPDPQFVDAAALDYTLKASSPAVDKGTDAVLTAANRLSTDAADLARPFSGTLVDIGAYELQGEGGPSLSIVKQGPHWIAAGVAADYALTIANNGVRGGEALTVVDVLPAGAEYVADSAGANGTFAAGQLTWQIGTLAPGESTFITYTVVASQTLVSQAYSVQSATDPAVLAQGKVMTTPLNAKIVAAINFFPRPDGFSFPNYGDSPDSDMTAADVAFIFGEEIACKTTNPCVLTATAEAWRKQWLTFVAGGHCAGMAMGSLDIFANAAVAPGDFQSTANLTFNLSKENARKYIALYATTQSLRPRNWSVLDAGGYKWNIGNPVTVLDTLIANLKDPAATDHYRLSFSKHPRDGGGAGHTVVPFAVEQFNDNEYLIYIYENNAPNRFDLAIRINRATGAWSYVGTTRPDQPMYSYYGDATSNNLSLTSWQWAHTFPKCMEGAQCPATTDAAPTTVGTVEVQLDGEGYQLVTRSDGKRAGFDLNTGEWIGEIEGAQAVDILTGLGLNTPPAVQIPHEEGMTYDVQIASRETAYGNTEAPANVNIAGPGFAMNLTDLVLNSPPPQLTVAEGEETLQATAPTTGTADLMTLGVDPAAKRITFAPGVDDSEAPSLALAMTNPDGSDYSVVVQNVAVAQGHAVALAFDAATQAVTIEGNSAAETNYQVALTRTNLDGTQDTFVSDAVSDGGNAGVTLQVGDEWNGTDAPAIQVVENSTLPAPVTGGEAQVVDDTAATEAIAACDPATIPAPTDADVMVRFVNASDTIGVVYWRDGNNELQEYHRLEPGATVDQATFLDHTWVVEDEAGNVLLEYTAAAEEKQCAVIEQP